MASVSDVVSAARVGGAWEQLSGKLLPRRRWDSVSFIFSKYSRYANVQGWLYVWTTGQTIIQNELTNLQKCLVKL